MKALVSYRGLQFLLFQAFWPIAIGGAAAGRPWLGPTVLPILVLLHLRVVDRALPEVWLLAAVGLIGYAADSVLVLSGLLSFPESARLGAPSTLWMVSLWINFGIALHGSLSWLTRRYVLGSLLGAIGGPLAYFSGAKVGAAVLAEPLWLSLGAVALEYILVVPLLFWLANVTPSQPRSP